MSAINHFALNVYSQQLVLALLHQEAIGDPAAYDEDVAEVERQGLQRPKTRTSQSWNGRQAQRKSRLQPSSKLCNVENTRAT